jgi:predicted RNA-binding protein associated with RNAse of E/G family|tara:strand:- start:3718 stop:4005 length:288 start_codon:yes stop_codon:yes gene_type:complete
VLKKVLTVLSNKDQKTFTFDQLDQLMQNVGKSQFSYDVFKTAYDTDPAVQALIKNFDKEKLTFKSDAMDNIPQDAKEPSADKTVSSMAKRATDLG